VGCSNWSSTYSASWQNSWFQYCVSALARCFCTDVAIIVSVYNPLPPFCLWLNYLITEVCECGIHCIWLERASAVQSLFSQWAIHCLCMDNTTEGCKFRWVDGTWLIGVDWIWMDGRRLTISLLLTIYLLNFLVCKFRYWPPIAYYVWLIKHVWRDKLLLMAQASITLERV
jgi:hypothetical protein